MDAVFAADLTVTFETTRQCSLAMEELCLE